jgi:hypothetical protein
VQRDFSTDTGVIATLRFLFARQAKGKRKLALWRCFANWEVEAQTTIVLQPASQVIVHEYGGGDMLQPCGLSVLCGHHLPLFTASHIPAINGS